MLNWMAYLRGHSDDYNEWEAMGNPGWGFKDVLPYFKKSEDFKGPQERDLKRYSINFAEFSMGKCCGKLYNFYI
jgi:choline dehydrogenase-like flavoprotein